MAEHRLIGRLRRGWRAVLIGALIGALLFGAYSWLSRSAGVFSKTLTFQLADPRAAMAERGLTPDLGVEDTATGVADLVQSTAVDSYDLGDVRVIARGVDGSRMVAVTITGSEDAVDEASDGLADAFPADRAQELAQSVDRALASAAAKSSQLQAELTQLDGQIADAQAGSDDVFRERLLLDRLEATRELSDNERQIGDLQRLRDEDPHVNTRLVVTTSGKSVGTPLLNSVLLGLVFGALVAVVVVLTRRDEAEAAVTMRQPEAHE